MPSIVRRAVSVAAVLALGAAVPAEGHVRVNGTGGASMPAPPEVKKVVCEDAKAWRCAPGRTVVVRGDELDDVTQVRFVGRAGTEDDRVAKPVHHDAAHLEVEVPETARSGPVTVVGRGGHRDRSNRWLRLSAPPAARETARAPAAATAPAVRAGWTYPIAGPHRYGTAVNHFGGGRGHQGEDVFADCGTPLVALTDAKVQHVAFQSRAGYYVVLQRADGESYAYMHLQAPATVAKGARVKAGDRVGAVGATGRASGCHLHFEQWTAPGWYTGGQAIDPLPLLRRLDPTA